jgi:hypothetical protein
MTVRRNELPATPTGRPEGAVLTAPGAGFQ